MTINPHSTHQFNHSHKFFCNQEKFLSYNLKIMSLSGQKRFLEPQNTSSKTQNLTNLNSLPFELLEKTLLFLPIDQIRHLCRVNKRVSAFCESEDFWEQLVKRDYNVDKLIGTTSNESGAATRSWKCLYQLLSSSVYVASYIANDGDFYTSVFLTLEDAIDHIIRRVESNEDFFHFNFSREILEKSNLIEPNMIDELITLYSDDILLIIEKDENKRRQFQIAEQLIKDEIRRSFLEDISLWIGTNQNDSYHIDYEPILSSKPSKTEYEFIRLLSEQSADIPKGSFEIWLTEINESYYITIKDGAVIFTFYNKYARVYQNTRVRPMMKDVEPEFIQFVESIAPHKTFYESS